VTLEDYHIAPAELREVLGHACPDDPATDDYNTRPGWEPFREGCVGGHLIVIDRQSDAQRRACRNSA